MKKVLKQKFFNRPTLTVAKELLGKYLVRLEPSKARFARRASEKEDCLGKIGKKETALMITEVEAYDGPNDKASHAHKGKTPRNAPMFGEAGKWYVYFTYGMHWMLNVVTGPKDYPAAILIRGTNKVAGPARLTKFFRIDKSFNEKPATRKTGVWFEDRGGKIKSNEIKRLPRVGVAYAGPVWSDKPYRFVWRSKVIADITSSANGQINVKKIPFRFKEGRKIKIVRGQVAYQWRNGLLNVEPR